MNLRANFNIIYFPTTGTAITGQVYIQIFDAETGNPTNGNNVIVKYQQNINGIVDEYEETVAGQTKLIYTGELEDTDPLSLFHTDFRIRSISAAPNPDPPVNVCNLKINYVTVDKYESAVGANDAQITIKASSGNAPITYSIDGDSYQSSPTFAGLSGGSKTVYVKDTINCTAQASVDIGVLKNLLIADPSVTVHGNTSRWNAAFNPVVFTYQRKDFSVTAVELDTLTQNARVIVNTDISTVVEGDLVYIEAGDYVGTYKVTGITGNTGLIINTPFTGTATGFININRLRSYYKILTRVTYTDKLTGKTTSTECTNRPDSKGITRADISNFLQSLLRAKDQSDFTQTYYPDENLCTGYSIAYATEWDEAGQTKKSAYVPVAEPYHALYAARQLGQRYGGNMQQYVPFAAVPTGVDKAKWITDFAEPAFSNGYPFDIGFIYSEDLVGLDVYCELALLDINRKPLSGGPATSYLLNNNGSWLLNEDESKFVLSRASIGDTPVPAAVGLNRLLINNVFTNEVYFLTIALKYNTGSTAHTITEAQTIRIDDAVDDQSVYLRWIGLTGCWNYYRFVYNQEVSLDVQNATIIKNHVFDWEHQDSIEEVISKTAGQKIKVVAEDLSVADIKGLQSIKYSPKVQMLVNKNPVKWQTIVINIATYSEYETRNGQAPFNVTFNLPAINIQTQ